MDTMERYKIQASIKDVIAILDSVPIRRDLIPEANVVQPDKPYGRCPPRNRERTKGVHQGHRWNSRMHTCSQ